MIGLTLKHLRYFNALAVYRHFGRAAKRCSISQPALSLQIKELEVLLGGPLVERTAKEIQLTTLGEDFWVRIRKILADVDELDSMVRLSNGPLSGRLRIGIIPTVAPYFLPSVIRKLSQDFPDLELQPRETTTQSLVTDIKHSRLDIAITALPVSESSLMEFELFEEDFVLVRPIGDAQQPIPDPQLLQKMRLLLLEEGHCFRDQALSFCKINPEEPRYLMEGSSLATLVQMVGANMGVTLIPEMAVPLETRNASVHISHFTGKAPSRSIGMIWRRTNPLSQQFKQIGAIIRKLKNQSNLTL